MNIPQVNSNVIEYDVPQSVPQSVPQRMCCDRWRRWATTYDCKVISRSNDTSIKVN